MVHVQVQLWHRQDCKVDVGNARMFLATTQKYRGQELQLDFYFEKLQ